LTRLFTTRCPFAEALLWVEVNPNNTKTGLRPGDQETSRDGCLPDTTLRTADSEYPPRCGGRLVPGELFRGNGCQWLASVCHVQEGHDLSIRVDTPGANFCVTSADIDQFEARLMRFGDSWAFDFYR
jgi:hypothetical protein